MRFWNLTVFCVLSSVTLTGYGANETSLSFHYSGVDIKAFCKKEKERMKGLLSKIPLVPSPTSDFKNTVGVFEQALAEFHNGLQAVIFLKDVSTDKAIRDAALACSVSSQQLEIETFAREDLYVAFKTATGKGERLSPDDKALLEEHLSQFKRNGLELTSKKRKEFLENKKQIIELESKYRNHLAQWEDPLWVSEKELDGLPPEFINSLQKKDSKFKLTLAYPHYMPVMENAKNAGVRKQMEIKFKNRGGRKNKDWLDKTLHLRHEAAVLLGYPNHAAFVLERRMAKSPDKVNAFLDSLQAKLKPRGEKDYKDLLELKRKETKNPAEKELFAWDWRYYENQLKKSKFDVDSETIRPYFPLETVEKGVFEIYQTLLGIKFEPMTNEPTWHPSVKLYRIKKKNTAIGYFYLDLFPRPGKFSHMAAFDLLVGYLKPDGSYQKPVAAIVGNFTPPTADAPSLLNHDEVVTFFHEFGHIMHMTLTAAKYRTFGGTNVKQDFVEAPSQMLENWCWEAEILDRLSGHYQNPKKKLPSELRDKLIKSRLANAGIQYLRQLSLAKVDMVYHSNATVDTTKEWQKAAKEISFIPVPEGTLPQASFGHIMGGYDATYYGYLWSEVYSADMFYSVFKKEGLLNPKTGKKYVKWILEPGGSQDPFTLIKGFIGREPTEDAFLKSLGL